MPTVSLYRRMLCEQFDKLPEALRGFHDLPEGGRGRGRFQIERGAGSIARMLGLLLRFPVAGTNVRLTLNVSVEGDRERWVRDFGGRRLKSIQWVQDGLLIEKAGLIRFAFRLSADEAGMRFAFQRAWLLSVPLPGFLSPQIEASVLAEDCGWRVDVQMSLPWGAPSYATVECSYRNHRTDQETQSILNTWRNGNTLKDTLR